MKLADQSMAVIPESAPFTPAQRAWLNGFFAGLDAYPLPAGAAVPTPDASATQPEESSQVFDLKEDFPWHDETMPIQERLALAQDRPLARRLMAAMGQLDCGQCGYLCQSYAEAIARGEDKDLGKCVPGGKPTQRSIKQLLAEAGTALASQSPSATSAPAGATPLAIAVSAGSAAASADGVTAVRPRSSREQPFQARLLSTQTLTAAPGARQVLNVVLSLAGSDIDYEPGDALGVWPSNMGEEVELLLSILRARGSEAVELDGISVSTREALLRRCNLRTPNEELYRLLARHARDAGESAHLQRLAALEAGEMQAEANPAEASPVDGSPVDASPGDTTPHDVLDVLVRYRSARPPVAEFVLALGRLQPRLYSIASSRRCYPGEVHLTVSVVRYGLFERDYQGVASNFFAERLQRGQRVPVYLQKAHGFALPDDLATPVIMIGPGTGIAPFRAFLQERAARAADLAAQGGANWLFFGNQRAGEDFLYRGEIEGWVRRGVLTRLDTAFSRDQTEKVYVQHRMLQQAALLWQWLQQGAHVYVCGDAQRMAADVDAALRQIAIREGGMDESAARQWLLELARQRRYCRDVY
jgi:sulfite reductase (NADPH) flavoprotein alpha-component